MPPAQIRVREDQEAIISALSPSECDALLDLRSFMQRSPYVVNEDASLSRGYRRAAPRRGGAGLAGGSGRLGGGATQLAAAAAADGHATSPPSRRTPTPVPECRLFRTLGLRHMFVSPPNPRVSGMITRKDVITGEWLRAGFGVSPWNGTAGWSSRAPPAALGARLRARARASLWQQHPPDRTSAGLPLPPCPPALSADNAKLALGRKANLGLVDSVAPSVLRPRLPFLAYAAYDPTAGSSRAAADDSSFGSPERLPLANGGDAEEAAAAGDGSETAGDRYQHPLTQRRRGGEAELAAVTVAHSPAAD